MSYQVHNHSSTILTSIALVSSSLYLLPLAYSQELSYTYSWGQFGIADSEFSSPEGIAVDQAGNVYVADTGNNRIQLFSSNGTFESVVGEYGISEQGLRYPSGIVVDPSSSNVYVADTGNNRISAFTSHLPANDTSSSNQESQTDSNDTGDAMILPGIF